MQKLNKIKNYAIGVVVSVVIVGLSINYFSKSKTIVPKTTNIPLARPNISSVYKKESELSFLFNLSPIEFPKELSVIEVVPGKTLSETEVFDIATKLNFGKDYINFTNGDKNYIYFFRNGASSLSVNATANSIAYRAPYKAIIEDLKLSDDDVKFIAIRFLSEKTPLKKEMLSLSFITPYNLGDEGDFKPVQRKDADVFKVNFVPVNTNYKLITVDPDQSPISVLIAKDGTVAKAEVSFLEGAKLSSTRYPVYTFEEMKTLTPNAKIISTDQYDSLDKLKSVTINSVEISYFSDSYLSTKYQPIFLIQGTAKNGAGVVSNVVLYLPAIK